MAGETMLMNALQLVRPRSFDAVRVPVPGLGSSDTGRILVRTAWVSMCGSDVAFYAGNKRLRSYPLPVGAPIHECVGEVVETESEQFRPGDWVVAMPDGDTGLAEFFVGQQAKAVRLPAELAGCDSCCLIQPLSTVINAVDCLGDVRGRSIAVVGLGSMGLLLCWLLRKRGAEPVLGIDPVEGRCRAAERLGVARAWPLRSIELVHASRQGAEGWEAPEICIEAVGHQMDTLNDCFELVRRRGTVVAFGVPDHAQYTIEYETFFRKNLHLVAVVTPEWTEYLAKARDLLLAHRAELEPLISHRLPIGDARKAFALYESRAEEVIKVVLNATEWDPAAG
jgi:threonine dehydrogenase-like Zn-dependent dehydrogenase